MKGGKIRFVKIKSFSFPIINYLKLEKIASIIEKQFFLIKTESVYLEKIQQIKSGLMSDLLRRNKMVKA